MADPILDMRAGMVAHLREKLPGVEIEEHPASDFSPQDITRAVAKRHLSLRVAFAGTPDTAEMSADEVDTDAAWAIYIVAKDGGDYKRDVTILKVLPSVLRAVTRNEWCPGIHTGKPEMVRSAQLFRGETEQSVSSAMVWGVSWKQQISIPADDGDSDDIRPFLELLVSYDLQPVSSFEEEAEAPTYEATDTIELEQS